MKKRATNNMNALTAAPERNVKKPNARLANPTIGPRRIRSASHPIGPAPRTKKATDAVEMKVIVPSDTPNVSAMSGPRIVIAACSSSSSEFSSNRMKKVEKPPLRSPSLSGISSPPTPGSRSSAKMTSAERSAWLAWRAASSSRTAAVSADADWPAVVASFSLTRPPGCSLDSRPTLWHGFAWVETNLTERQETDRYRFQRGGPALVWVVPGGSTAQDGV